MNALDRAKQIAPELGEGWSAQEGHWVARGEGSDAFLVGPDDVQLHLVAGGYGRSGRLSIDGRLGDELRTHRSYRGASKTEITVADTKTGAQIARDIERRLLPAWRIVLEKAQDRKAAVDVGEHQRDQVAERLAVVLNGAAKLRPAREGQGGERNLHIGHYTGNYATDITGEIVVRSGGLVDFALRVGADKAEEVVQGLAGALRTSVGAGS